MSKIIDFLFRGEVQRIFDQFTSLLDIRIAFFSPEGREFRVGLGKLCCSYCRKLREDLGLRDVCLTQDREKRREAVERGEMVAYRCHGGMNEAVVPVIAVGQTIGYLMIGQFRTTRRAPARLRRLWKARHGNEALQTAFEEAPYYTNERARAILELFAVLVRFIVSERMISVSERSPLEPLLSYIGEHPEEHLSLADAARMTCTSPSTVAHAFKRETGKSFKRYQIERRLDRADEYLRTSPGMTIGQIAAKLGYADALYFSRIYRKHRGRPPSALRKRKPIPSEG
jgi:AraC-like DNA-binding protein/ligand-binding sensor protein